MDNVKIGKVYRIKPAHPMPDAIKYTGERVRISSPSLSFENTYEAILVDSIPGVPPFASIFVSSADLEECGDDVLYGDWMATFTGKKFHPLCPTVDMICLTDIAHALARQCRYNGHCKYFHSVAQHSLNVHALLTKLNDPAITPRILLYGLLHDAAEAYLGDIPRPLKRYLPNYAQLEEMTEKTIWEAYCLPVPLESEWNIVMRADNMVLRHEAKYLADSWETWDLPYPDLEPYFNKTELKQLLIDYKIADIEQRFIQTVRTALLPTICPASE